MASTPTLAEFEGYFERPWVDTLFFGFDAPIEYMPDYGREVARTVAMAGLLLTLNFPAASKEPLLVYFVQYGIDLYGAVQAGHGGWGAHGGHGAGRKLPIVLAGLLLGDTGMQSPQASFSEDKQTMFGNGWTGATALYAGHVGAQGNSNHVGWGAYEHLQPGSWLDPIGESYRRCCTSIGWVGEALTARLTGADQVWNHPAFFAYVDRWMTEDDSAHLDIIQAQTGRSYHASWSRQGQAWDPFVEEMWATHRNSVGARPAPPENLRMVQSQR